VTLRNPLLAWLRRLDPRLVDGLLVAALAAAVLVQQLHLNPGHVYRPAMAVVGGVLPLLWRRRYPLAAHLLVIAALVAGGQQPVTASLFATFVGFYSVAAYSRWRVPAVVLPMLGALTLWLLVPLSHPSIPAWGLELTGGLGLWVIGNSVASLRTRAFSLEERALRVERERELSTQLALAGERARISLEERALRVERGGRACRCCRREVGATDVADRHRGRPGAGSHGLPDDPGRRGRHGGGGRRW